MFNKIPPHPTSGISIKYQSLQMESLRQSEAAARAEAKAAGLARGKMERQPYTLNPKRSRPAELVFLHVFFLSPVIV